MVQITEQNVTAMWQDALDLRAMHESEGPPSQEDAEAQAKCDAIIAVLSASCPSCDPTDG